MGEHPLRGEGEGVGRIMQGGDQKSSIRCKPPTLLDNSRKFNR